MSTESGMVLVNDAAIFNWLLAHSFPNGDNIGWGAGCEQQRPDIIRGEIIDAMNGWHGHCQFCDGSGQDDRGYEACVRCKGKGNIADLRKEDIYDYYEALSEKFAAAPASPPTPALDGWQPIETAPKDGTQILVSHGGQSACVEWSGGGEWEITHIGNEKIVLQVEPTHWQPLPEPPTVPYQRQWTGPGELERSGYIDKEPK